MLNLSWLNPSHCYLITSPWDSLRWDLNDRDLLIYVLHGSNSAQFKHQHIACTFGMASRILAFELCIMKAVHLRSIIWFSAGAQVCVIHINTHGNINRPSLRQLHWCSLRILFTFIKCFPLCLSAYSNMSLGHDIWSKLCLQFSSFMEPFKTDQQSLQTNSYH